jgi:hypothetical protein
MQQVMLVPLGLSAVTVTSILILRSCRHRASHRDHRSSPHEGRLPQPYHHSTVTLESTTPNILPGNLAFTVESVLADAQAAKTGRYAVYGIELNTL